jgi:hypothetical protein
MPKVVKISLIISILSFIGIFVPYYTPLGESSNSYAISAGLTFVFILAIVTTLVYRKMSIKETAVKSGDKLIAHWTYSDEEWNSFTEEEHKINSADKKMLFYIISGFAVFFGALFMIMDPESGIFVAGAMLGLIVIIAFTAFLSIYLAHRKNLKKKGEAYISIDGVIINGTFHAWKLFGAKFEGVTYVENVQPRYLEFTYSIIASHGRQNQSVRLPVPKKEEKSVQLIIETLEKHAG